ncbi:MAG: hypothetical protein AAF270_02210 [Pseudomonadota bacterium]
MVMQGVLAGSRELLASTRIWLRRLLAPVVAVVLVGCSSSEFTAPPVPLTSAAEEVPEARLLDIGLIEFEPGLPDEGRKLPADVFPDIRRAEAKFFPYHLKSTLQNTGHWGAVRVIPNDSVIADVYIDGVVEHSDGNKVRLRFNARDSAGQRWFSRRYSMRTGRTDYGRNRDRSRDPYQNVFNEFANDLFEAFNELSDDEIDALRTTSRMRFYADMAPSVFGDYVEQDDRGRMQVVRLPSAEDPMVRRLDAIRERDALFQDTLNEHYANFYYGIALPYADWREASREAELEYQRLRRSALLRGLAGVATVAAASEISRGDGNDSGTERRTRSTLKNYAIGSGLQTFFSSFGQLSEARLQRQSISELSESFGQEAAPMVVDVLGQTRRLTGTASAQYDQWRELLRRINEQETGDLDSLDIGINGRMSGGESDEG